MSSRWLIYSALLTLILCLLILTCIICYCCFCRGHRRKSRRNSRGSSSFGWLEGRVYPNTFSLRPGEDHPRQPRLSASQNATIEHGRALVRRGELHWNRRYWPSSLSRYSITSSENLPWIGRSDKFSAFSFCPNLSCNQSNQVVNFQMVSILVPQSDQASDAAIVRRESVPRSMSTDLPGTTISPRRTPDVENPSPAPLVNLREEQ